MPYSHTLKKHRREWAVTLKKDGTIVLQAYKKVGCSRSASWDITDNDTGIEEPYDQYLCDAIDHAHSDGEQYTTDAKLLAAINSQIPPALGDPALEHLPEALTAT